MHRRDILGKYILGMVLLVLPSVAWSIIYRAPKLVVDPLIILPIELFSTNWMKYAVRLAWVSICASMLLLEWNIFPESYMFYTKMLSGITGTSQGFSIVAAIIILGLFVIIPIPEHSARRRWVVISIAVTLYGGTALAKSTSWGRENLTGIRVPMLRAAQVAITDGDRFLYSSVVGPGSNVITYRLYTLLGEGGIRPLPPKVLVILLEAWGERPRDLKVLAMKASEAGFDIIGYGYNRFHGSTLPAEIRELCGQALNFEIKTRASRCLPKMLADAGYDTAALHGYEGFFYSRNIIYPAIGFRRVLFRPDLGYLAECGGAFAGACDDAVATTAVNLLAEPGKRFVYMLSLTAHEPVDQSVFRRPYISGYDLLSPGSSGQRVNRALIMHVLREIQRHGAWPGGAIVYVTGDHNPPSAPEDMHLPVGQVPYILFRLGRPII